MLSHEEHVALVLPGPQGTDYHDTIVSALACRRLMLDAALDQFMTRAKGDALI